MGLIDELVKKSFVVGVGGLALIIWGKLPADWGVPEWLRYSLIIVVCVLFVVVQWFIKSRKQRLTDAEKCILGLMLEENAAMSYIVSGKPQLAQAGRVPLYGPDETPSKYAPVAMKYLEAYKSLILRGYLQPLGTAGECWQLSQKGAAVAQNLPAKFRDAPPDVVKRKTE